MKNKKCCYREPDFLPIGYIPVAFISNMDGIKRILPFISFHSNIKTLKKEVNFFRKRLAEDKDPINVDGIIVIKVKFKKTFPLNKNHWTDGSDVVVDDGYRIKQYLKMLDDVYQFYNIIILPRFYNVKEKKWLFRNSMPILITADDKKMNELIISSDEPVDTSAKSIGIYSIEKIKGFDIDTGKFIDTKKDNINFEANC